MDLYFQALAWLNKGVTTPDTVARARSFFDRALTADPDNVDALIGSARVQAIEGVNSFVPDPVASFAAAEAKLTKALSSVPDHAGGHMWLGLVNIFTRRASLGIAECEHALALDRNLASAHAAIGFGRIGIARSEETSAATSKQSLGVGGRSRPTEAIPTHILSWPPPSRSLIDLTRRIPQLRRVSRSTRPSPSPAPASIGLR
jgi:hypothetical protein